MRFVRPMTTRLAAVLVGTAAVLTLGSVQAGRPERRVTATEAASKADPGAKALKGYANEAKAATTKVDALVDKIDKDVRELESTTDKIQNKKDRAAVTDAARTIEGLKTMVGKLGDESENLRKVAMQMDREIKSLKK